MQVMALIVVDVQSDFCPGGALAVDRGDTIIPRINKVVRAFEGKSLPIFFTRDWHPTDHVSFRNRGGPWPPHCVMGTPGAEFHPALKKPEGSMVVSKGSLPDSEAYSGFQGTDLATRLRKLGVREVVIGGLATDYCVKETALDAIEAGFEASILEDCIMGVEVHKGDSIRALQAMVKAGAKKTDSLHTVNVISGA